MSTPVSERLGFADLVDKVAADAPRRDTERLLLDDLRPELRARKIGAIRLPRADGTRLPLTEFFAFVRELAAADSNLAHSLRNHYAGIENALLDPTPSSPRLLALAADGLLFGGAAQQQSGSSGPACAGEAVRVGDDEYLVSCRRYYATGSLYADYLTVSVTLDDGVARTVLIESDRPGVELPDDWDGFGQRLTGSGSIVLDHVRMTSADFFQRPVTDPAAPRYPFTFNQVYLTSVVAGIGHRALRDAVELVGERTRNYYHGTAQRTADEPVILAAIGVASAKAFAATATIAAAAGLLEESWDLPARLRPLAGGDARGQPGQDHRRGARPRRHRRAHPGGQRLHPVHEAGARPALAQRQGPRVAQPVDLQAAGSRRLRGARHQAAARRLLLAAPD